MYENGSDKEELKGYRRNQAKSGRYAAGRRMPASFMLRSEIYL